MIKFLTEQAREACQSTFTVDTASDLDTRESWLRLFPLLPYWVEHMMVTDLWAHGGIIEEKNVVGNPTLLTSKQLQKTRQQQRKSIYNELLQTHLTLVHLEGCDHG